MGNCRCEKGQLEIKMENLDREVEPNDGKGKNRGRMGSCEKRRMDIIWLKNGSNCDTLVSHWHDCLLQIVQCYKHYLTTLVDSINLDTKL